MKKIILFVLFSSFLFGFGGAKFLMPNEAFIPHAKLNDKMQIEADIKIADGIYLYVDEVKFELANANGLEIVDIKKPKADKHDGDAVYLKSPKFLVTLKNDGKISQKKDIVFKISYQGCSTAGLCYEHFKIIFRC